MRLRKPPPIFSKHPKVTKCRIRIKNVESPSSPVLHVASEEVQEQRSKWQNGARRNGNTKVLIDGEGEWLEGILIFFFFFTPRQVVHKHFDKQNVKIIFQKFRI